MNQKISIVIPVFNESKNLKSFDLRLKSVTSSFPDFNWEYIFVNDGSHDDSMGELRELASKNENNVVIDLSRNFGKELALTAGVFEASDPDALICIDADLQHPPELIPQMINSWNDGADIVATIRISIEKQPILRKMGSKVFYWLMSKISGTKMESQTTDFRLYDKKVIKAFSQMTEHERMFRGIMDWMGFRKIYLEFEASARQEGSPGYSYPKLIELAVNSITSFSLWPLKVTGYLGLFITSISGLLLVWMLLNYFVINLMVFSPLAIVVVANTFLIGLILVSIGLVALYVGKIHTEVANRPLFIVRERLNSANPSPVSNKIN